MWQLQTFWELLFKFAGDFFLLLKATGSYMVGGVKQFLIFTFLAIIVWHIIWLQTFLELLYKFLWTMDNFCAFLRNQTMHGRRCWTVSYLYACVTILWHIIRLQTLLEVLFKVLWTMDSFSHWRILFCFR